MHVPKAPQDFRVPHVPKAPHDFRVAPDPKVYQAPKVCEGFTAPPHSTGFPKELVLAAQPARELLNTKGISGKGKGHGSDASTKHAGWRDAMLRDLHSMTAKNAEEKPWPIRKGPAPGLKSRGGTPPGHTTKDIYKPFNDGNASRLFGDGRFPQICPK